MNRAIIGGVIWLVGVVVLRPNPFELEWGRALLLLAPLVLLPLGLELAGLKASFAARLQLPTALLFAAAFLLEPGPTAATLTLPWLIVTFLLASEGVRRALPDQRWPELAIAAALAYVAVGAAWASADRLGYRPIGFDAVIVLLTAIHFHYAGFTLPLLTGLAARRDGSAVARWACLAVVTGVPFTAVGITATHLGGPPAIETASAWWMALGGILTAVMHLRLIKRANVNRWVRVGWAIVAASLLFSMTLAVLYGSRHFVSIAWLDIPWMRALHGTANAIGFGLVGVIAWHAAVRCEESSVRLS